MRPRQLQKLQEQRELLEEAGRLSAQYGCGVIENSNYRLVVERPDEPLSNRQREKVARATVLVLSRILESADMRTLRPYVRELREANAIYEAVQQALEAVSSTALEAARGEAFVELFRAGLDAHPAYAAVARANDQHELLRALHSAQLQTA